MQASAHACPPTPPFFISSRDTPMHRPCPWYEVLYSVRCTYRARRCRLGLVSRPAEAVRFFRSNLGNGSRPASKRASFGLNCGTSTLVMVSRVRPFCCHGTNAAMCNFQQPYVPLCTCQSQWPFLITVLPWMSTGQASVLLLLLLLLLLLFCQTHYSHHHETRIRCCPSLRRG